MKFTILNIANKMPSWVLAGCDEYLKRINHGNYSCRLIEIKSEKTPKKSKIEIIESEAIKFRSQIPVDSFVILLDERGEKLTSIKFSDKLKKIELMHSHICFIIGGADGVSESLKRQANYVMQLSDFTFPHALVRVILLEQIYRAISIMNNHPYHRE